ncbi:MAG: hypothetical protein IID40_05250 [Planctomycetes bacterium]|nr:hypothetical protein [Planctomycetota bacterium]
MEAPLRLPNPIWWAQLRLIGGRRIGGIVGAWTVALVVCPQVIRRFFPTTTPAHVLKVLAFAQCLLMVLGGCSAIHKALTRDFSTKMLESHRLSPMSAATVTLGYAFGPTAQILLLFAVTALYGTVLLFISGLSPASWLLGNAVLLSAAVMVWSGAICAGIGGNKPVSLTGIIVVGGFLGGMVMMAMPGLGLISGAFSIVAAYLGMTGKFDLVRISSAVTEGSGLTAPVVAVLLVSNVFMALLWLSAAARRYRRPDRPAFGAAWGTLLLIIWLIPGGLGIVLADRFPGLPFDGRARLQFIVTVLLSLLLAVLPLSGAAIDRARIIKGARSTRWAERISSRWVAVAAVLLICGVMGLSGISWAGGDGTVFKTSFQAGTAWAWGCTAAALLAGLLAVDGFFRVMYLARHRIFNPAIVFILVAWLAAPTVDYALGVFRGRASGELFEVVDFSFLLGCSPLGTIVVIWNELTAPVLPGLAVQWVLAAVMTGLAVKAERMETRRRAQGMQQPGLNR